MINVVLINRFFISNEVIILFFFVYKCCHFFKNLKKMKDFKITGNKPVTQN